MMKSVKFLSYWLLILMAASPLAQADDTDDLNLDDVADYNRGWFHHFNTEYWGNGTGIGQGGYGDAMSRSNVDVCNKRNVDYKGCATQDPDANQQEWRFIKYIGWRKFTKYGAGRKDWNEYKLTLGWSFHPTYGTLLH